MLQIPDAFFCKLFLQSLPTVDLRLYEHNHFYPLILEPSDVSWYKPNSWKKQIYGSIIFFQYNDERGKAL